MARRPGSAPLAAAATRRRIAATSAARVSLRGGLGEKADRLRDEGMRPEGGAGQRDRQSRGPAESLLVQGADQEARHVLERGGPGQGDGVLPAIEEPPVPDLGDARLQHRQAPVESGRGRDGRAAEPRLSLRQGLHVLESVETLARVMRRGKGADQPAAHIGIEARPADAEAGRGLFGRCEIEGCGVHMLIC